MGGEDNLAGECHRLCTTSEPLVFTNVHLYASQRIEGASMPQYCFPITTIYGLICNYVLLDVHDNRSVLRPKEWFP